MLQYPLTLTFKVLAIAPQVKVADAAGQTILYVRQKVLALREDVRVFADEAQQTQLYQINADRILDFSARYAIRNVDGETVGTIQRKGMRSLWSASYTLLDSNGDEVGIIREENPLAKVVDGLIGEIPFVGWLASMLINPSYIAEFRGQPTLRLKKRPSFFERSFNIERVAGDLDERDEQLLLTSFLMTVLLERDRG